MPSTPLSLILEWRGKARNGGPVGSAFYQCAAELEAALLDEDDAALAYVTAERDQYRQWYEALVQTRMTAPEAERDRLRAALERYGQHEDGCPAWPQFTSHFQQATTRGACACGLTAALSDTGQKPDDQRSRLSDDQLRRLWRVVNGPRAGLNGPLIRFAGLIQDAVKEP